MQCRDSGLDLIDTGGTVRIEANRALEQRQALIDRGSVPRGAVLFLEQDQLARLVSWR